MSSYLALFDTDLMRIMHQSEIRVTYMTVHYVHISVNVCLSPRVASVACHRVTPPWHFDASFQRHQDRHLIIFITVAVIITLNCHHSTINAHV